MYYLQSKKALWITLEITCYSILVASLFLAQPCVYTLGQSKFAYLLLLIMLSYPNALLLSGLEIEFRESLFQL